MLKWVVKQSKAGGGDDDRILTGHYRTLSEDRHKRQRSVDSSISSTSSSKTTDSKSKGKERIGRPKHWKHGKTTRAKSSSGILDEASYNKVQDWDVNDVKERLKEAEEDKKDTDSPKDEKHSDSNGITLSYLENLSHIQSLEKLTNFRDPSSPTPVQIPNPSDLPHHLKDEGIDVKGPADFDPNVICGSKMSMMDESFEIDHNNDTKSIKSSSDHSENQSENGDSSTDSAVVMGDVTEHDLPKVHNGLHGFAAGIQSEDLDTRAPQKELKDSQKDSSPQPVAPPRNRSRKQKSAKVKIMAEDKDSKKRQDGPHTEEEELEMEDELDSLPARIFMRVSS